MASKSPLSKIGSWSIFRDWKPMAVIVVFFWSLTTLFRIEPESTVNHWIELSNLSAQELNLEIQKRCTEMPRWQKMNFYEKEHVVKEELEKAQLANNIQILKRIGIANLAQTLNLDKKIPTRYVLFTNLKLGLDLRGGSQLLLKAMPAPPQVPEITHEVMNGVQTVINNRINSLGVSETIVQRAGIDRLIVEMPGIKDPQQAKDRIGTTAMLEFKELAIAPDGTAMWKDTGLTGADFKRAQATAMMAGSTYRVSFEFKPEGAKKFGELTKRHVGQQIGIFLDGVPTERGPDGRSLSLQEYHGVTVKEPILTGTGEITGSFTQDQAVDLSVKLNAGALPVPVQILEERTVGATLGQDSIKKSMVAGFIGIATVMVFMLIVYGWAGLVADVALILYTLATLAIFISMSVTLTLAGIAGFILSIGMAVDANILIFERTKEELKNGKALYTAIEAGFNRAFSAIFDSNANSLIACAVLMMFGTSIVKGFAVTLAIGVAVSMFTAITASRTMLHLIPRSFGLFGQKFDSKTSTIQKPKQKEAV
ncbi:MAG: protein translocase subunit SecD [Candidatus Melainabacteria bacterium]|nr:MAG: protein translocase subunit SecD [Candidatus Melainabacteria bacterium]